MGISKECERAEVENIRTENSSVIDRIYSHEFLMNELDAAVAEYESSIVFDMTRDEFNISIREMKDILNKRFVNDLKQILHMA